MIGYTEGELRALRRRWKGHEEELQALIPLFKKDRNWHTSAVYEAVLAALGSLPEGIEAVFRDLRGAQLPKADLSGAQLWKADLSGAYLWKASLSGADLEEANLSGANLWDADLSRALLWKANLSGAGLWKANLSIARLEGADLSGADIEEANLSEIRLGGTAGLHGADVSGANLRNIRSFSNANFTHTRWWEAQVDEGSAFYIYLQTHFPPEGEPGK